MSWRAWAIWAAQAPRDHGWPVDDALLTHPSPLGWEHIRLTGDYLWRGRVTPGVGKFRPLRPIAGNR